MTLEPVDAPDAAVRAVLEHRAQRLRQPAADLGRHLLRLVTLLRWGPDAQVMVEISQCAEHRPLRLAGGLTVHVVEAPYPASSAGARRDGRGLWQWSVVLRDLPLERGGCAVRVSGAGLPECHDYALVPLDAYWAGRSDLIGTATE
ncbi:hypothetical protein ACFQV2_24210 [Actinokineospora soli]|uniref:Uncharacterized protein n=1 Tax=Actinokineospora soli TaxID=1048753 RepID=A0ABW2TQM6_9PSEU